MDIILVGLSHKTAPIEVREKLAVPETRLPDALARLLGYPGIREGLLLSTCNRVEVYAVVDQVEAGFLCVQEFLADTHLSLSSEQLTPHLYLFDGERAIAHLFRVAASLDSMIVGEPQILGQLKDAFEVSLSHKASGLILNKLIQKSISVAKLIRTETKIAENAVSISSAAVELAKMIFSDLAEKTVLLVGAGEMAQLAARHLLTHGVGHVRITTRDPANARRVAEEFHGVPVPFEEFRQDMAEADIVLCSTGATHYLIRKPEVEQAIRRRMNRPMFLIDISVPRNIDPAVKDIDNAFLFDIDDLQSRVDDNKEVRGREAVKAEGMIEEEVGGMVHWLKSLEVTPTIVSLRRQAEQIKGVEVEKALARLAHLPPHERNVIEALAAGIVNKLLHMPVVALKAEAQSANGAAFVEAVRRLYNLDSPDLAMKRNVGLGPQAVDSLISSDSLRDASDTGEALDDPASVSSQARIQAKRSQ
jgi:glutamyl-tRNA reductase